MYVTSKFKKKPSCIIFFLFFESPPYTIPENISSVSDKNLIRASNERFDDLLKNRKNKAKIHISGCLKNCGLSKQTSILINSSGGEKSVSVKDEKFQHLASKISMELNK